MAKTSHRIPLYTYDKLNQYARAYAEGKFNLFVLTGGPGLAKTRTVRAALGDKEYLLLDSHATPLAMYLQLFIHQDQPVLIDDLDAIYTNNNAVMLLKALCNTERVKTLRWHSSVKQIGYDDHQTPPEFQTTSQVCIISNDWKTLNANVEAIEDRAICAQFSPSTDEVHRQAGLWFEDKVVYDFIGENLNLIAAHSLRNYVKGRDLRIAMPDAWQDDLLAIMGAAEKMRHLLQILNDPSFLTEKQREEAFIARRFGDRSTYYRHKKKLEEGRLSAAA